MALGLSLLSDPEKISRRAALWLVALIWAAIYLPALGSLEIKGEEGRRLLPAVAMLETGKWIVPQVGGVPYLSKPPLINWLAAGSFRLAGSRSEWAARAPSALAVLALGLATVGCLAAWLTPAGALLAAIFLLTNIGLMEKGRLAEIEALYLSLYGIALVSWLGAWQREAGRPTWRAWTLPWVFLGLGLLTKGPLHLVFFYAVVVAVLFCAGRLRDLWNWWHLAGIALMLAVFGAWGVPYLQQVASQNGGDVWLAQFQSRLEVNEGFHFKSWILNIPRGLGNFLPWVVMMPLWWRGGKTDTPDDAILRGGRWAVTACFLAVSLAPGGQPRYTMPLLVPASVLLALVFRNCRAGAPPAVTGWLPIEREESAKAERTSPVTAGGAPALQSELPAWLPVVWTRVIAGFLALAAIGAVAAVIEQREAWPWAVGVTIVVARILFPKHGSGWPLPLPLPLLVFISAMVMALITADYAIGAVPRFRRAEAMRPMAAQIEASVPPGEPIAVYRPGFVPFLYYLRPGLVYAQKPGDLPATVNFLLVRADDSESLFASLRERHADWRIAMRASDKRLRGDPRSAWLLVRLNPPPEPRL